MGAARADATPSQLVHLRDVLLPALEGHYLETADESEVRLILAQIMGEDWAPTGEWAAQIGLLLVRTSVPV